MIVQDQKDHPRLERLSKTKKSSKTRKVIYDQKGRPGPKGLSSLRSDLDNYLTLTDFQSEFLPKAYNSDHIYSEVGVNSLFLALTSH